MKIVVLCSPTQSPNQYAFLSPIYRAKTSLLDQDLTFRVYTDHQMLVEADVLCVSSKYFSSWWQQQGFTAIADFLQAARQRFNKLVWFDLSDSTGTTHFDMLPYVDTYVKGQLLKDKSQYRNTWVGARVFTDFCHQYWGINDVQADEAHLNHLPAEFALLDKVKLGWNSGLAYYGSGWQWLYRMQSLVIFSHKLVSQRWLVPSMHRPIPCSCRIGTDYNRNTVAHPRQLIRERLRYLMPTDKLSIKKYFRELAQSIAAVSPFGLGEISLRDFELIRSGVAIIKQNMDHLETWPNLWQPDKTYLNFAWDLTDLEATVEQAIADPTKMVNLAEQAQTHYAFHFTQDGSRMFAERLLKLVK